MSRSVIVMISQGRVRPLSDFVLVLQQQTVCYYQPDVDGWHDVEL